jgi:F-type H+-transporting ATPase subunit b
MAFDGWTLALQAVNVVILVWLLGRFFYRPVAGIIEKRQADARKLLLDAQAARDEAEKSQAAVAATRQGSAAEREAILISAKKDAEAARTGLLEEARKQADALRVENEAAWKQERAAAQAVVIQGAGALAVEISRRLLDRLPKGASTSLFVEVLCADLRDLPGESRKLLASAAERGISLEIVSAAPLDEAQRKLCSDALNQAAGRKVDATWHTDPTLIAGIEIRGPEIVLNDSWGNDLDRILKEVTGNARNSSSA